MQRFMVINGVRLDNATGLPSIDRTEEGAAIGNIPGWDGGMLTDPDYVSTAEQWVRNRARPVSKGPVLGGTLRLGTFDNTATAFNPISGDNFQYRSTVDLNPNAWSAFAVIQPVASTGAPMDVIKATTSTTDLCLRLSIDAAALNDFIVYESTGALTRRAEYTANFTTRTQPTLMMVTFSVEKGITIYDNGTQVVQAEGDKRPLVAGLTGDNNITNLNLFRGRAGYSGILNVDLSKTENSGYRRAIEKFVMNKYGIV